MKLGRGSAEGDDEFLREDVPVGLALCTPAGHLTDVNKVLAGILGRTPSDLRGRNYVDLVHPEDRGADEARSAELSSGAAIGYRLRERYLRPDGELRWVMVRASLVPASDTANGSPLLVRRVVDVTDQVRAERDRDRFFSLSPELIAVTGPDGVLKEVNQAWRTVLGWTRAELVGRHPVHLMHPEDRTWAVAAFNGGALQPERNGPDLRFRAKDGSYRWIRWSAVLVPEEKAIYRWGNDVTAEFTSKEDLRRREAQLEDAQAIAHLGSWEWDFATRKVTCSTELFRIFGVEPARSALDHQPLFERVEPGDRERIRSAVLAAMEADSPFSLEGRIRRADGVERIVHLRGRFVTDATGRGRLVGTMQDVTAGRRAEENLRASEERFRSIFEQGPMGIAIVDATLRILEVNDAFAEMVGRDLDGFQGVTLTEITHPDDVEPAVMTARRAFGGEVADYDIEQRFTRSDGAIIWARVRVKVVEGIGDADRYGFVLVEDITETKEAERARREFDAMKDAFIRVVAHDLQGPLSIITALANHLGESGNVSAHDQVDILRRIASQSEKLQKMITNILDVDRLYQDGVRVVRRPTDLDLLVNGVVQTLGEPSHPLSIDVEPAIVHVDPDQLVHILANLLDNAFRHTDPGTPVRLHVATEDTNVIVIVEDGGPGVPDDLKEAIFELFRTGGSTGRTGIGLWSVARFAELHGGWSRVEDRPGGGARFIVSLAKSG
jgi:PAS domain S-box-containing protein